MMRLAAERPPPPPPPPEPEVDEFEDAPSVTRQGIITTAAAAARKVRDGDETPADGVAAAGTGGKQPPPKKRRRPGWAGVIAAMLAGGPVWTETRQLIDEVLGKDEAVAAAAEMGELKGRLDEQSTSLHELHGKVAANEAGDLEASFNGALEFRHLDKQITSLGKNIDRLLDAEQIPPADRTALPETPTEIRERHDHEIRAYREARAKADREALERSLAEGDTVGP